MSVLTRNPADAYRRVDLEARIEAASGEALTLICLEEAVAALGQAILALEKTPDSVPNDQLARAHAIAVWLARGVSWDNPLHQAMTQFYGGLAATITRNLSRASIAELSQVREDFADLLEAARTA